MYKHYYGSATLGRGGAIYLGIKGCVSRTVHKGLRIKRMPSAYQANAKRIASEYKAHIKRILSVYQKNAKCIVQNVVKLKIYKYHFAMDFLSSICRFIQVSFALCENIFRNFISRKNLVSFLHKKNPIFSTSFCDFFVISFLWKKTFIKIFHNCLSFCKVSKTRGNFQSTYEIW